MSTTPAAKPDTKTLCTFCGVVDQVTVSARGRVLGSGRLGACLKGASFFRESVRGSAQDAERFTAPLIRTPYGWEKISWDYAIDMVADSILADRAAFGRDAVAFYGVGQMTLESMWVAKKFFQGHLGTNNICSNAEQCLANNAGGHELVFGNEGPFSCYDDYLSAEAIFLYGHNPAANHPTIFQRYIRQNRDAIKVVVDPRRTDTVDALLRDGPHNLHLPINSGSDVLLNCVIARRLLDRGWYDPAYVARHVDPDAAAEFFAFLRQGPFDFDEGLRRVTPPELPLEEMKRRVAVACELWRDKKVVTGSSVGINQTTGSSGVASILNLHLLTGSIGTPGRGHVRLAGQSNASGELALGYSGRLFPFRMQVSNPEHREAMANIWGLPAWKLSDVPGLPVASFATSPRLRTLFIFGTNPARNFPNLKQWRDKLMDVCLVYVDSYYNPEILEYADIILPCRTKHEISGTFLNGERRLQHLAKVNEPPAEAWGDVRIVCSVARRMAERLSPAGEGHFDAPRSPEEADALARAGNLDLMKERLDADFDYPLDATGEPDGEAIWNEIQRASRGFYNEFVDGDGEPITYDHIKAGEGVQWAGARRYVPPRDPDAGPIFSGVFAQDRRRATFHTPPRERLVPYVAREGDLFTLITGRGQMGPGVLATNIAMFNSATATGKGKWPEENRVYLSTADAERLAVAAGDSVELSNEIGAIRCRVEVTPDVPTRHAYLTFHPDKKGTCPNFLTRSDNIDPHTWQPLLKDTQVEIRPVRAPVP